MTCCVHYENGTIEVTRNRIISISESLFLVWRHIDFFSEWLHFYPGQDRTQKADDKQNDEEKEANTTKVKGSSIMVDPVTLPLATQHTTGCYLDMQSFIFKTKLRCGTFQAHR